MAAEQKPGEKAEQKFQIKFLKKEQVSSLLPKKHTSHKKGLAL